MSVVPDSLLTLLTTLPVVKYGLLFLLVIIEGPITTMGSGILISTGHLAAITTGLVVIAADLLSDFVYYAFGYWGRTKSLEKLTDYFFRKWPVLNALERALHKRTAWIIIGGKLSHLAGLPILVAAGLARVPFKKFVVLDTIATVIKSTILIMIGYYFGEFATTLNRYLQFGTIIVFILFMIVICVYAIIGKRVDKKIILKE